MRRVPRARNANLMRIPCSGYPVFFCLGYAMPHTIRLATAADAADLLSTIHGAFAQYHAVVPQPSSLREDSASIAQRLATQTAFIAHVAHQPVGCVFCYPDEHAGDFYLGRLAVLPAHRRHGLASQLVAAVANLAHKNGYQRVTLEVRIAFEGNVRLFNALGFEVYGTGTHAGFDQPTWYKMARTLAVNP